MVPSRWACTSCMQCVAAVVSGGKKGDWTVKMKEEDILALELKEFMKLLKNEGTMARIEHMLENGKPLRN